jgi:5-methylcytosine-specific restriction endonuclease McrA
MTRPSRPESAVCLYCGIALTGATFTWDHMTAHALGGQNRWWNRVPACPRCNKSKDDKPFLDIMCERWDAGLAMLPVLPPGTTC